MIGGKDPVCENVFELCNSQSHEDFRGLAYAFYCERCHHVGVPRRLRWYLANRPSSPYLCISSAKTQKAPN
ncbi:hypothetical protein Barb4_03791 [Bacteroidales bacterium Barb4]|nr:hypothetical protein Barb4_03791 [Bacteroidales bacterium Barb4]